MKMKAPTCNIFSKAGWDPFWASDKRSNNLSKAYQDDLRLTADIWRTHETKEISDGDHVIAALFFDPIFSVCARYDFARDRNGYGSERRGSVECDCDFVEHSDDGRLHHDHFI